VFIPLSQHRRAIAASHAHRSRNWKLVCDCSAMKSQRSRIAAHAHRSRNWKLSFRGFLRCGEKLTWSASRLRRAAHDINRQNQHVRRFSPARCEVFSDVEKNSSFSSSRLRKAACVIDRHTVVIFTNANGAEVLTFVSGTVILHVQLVSGFSLAQHEVFSGMKNSSF
jgi:hypothetical protein